MTASAIYMKTVESVEKLCYCYVSESKKRGSKPDSLLMISFDIEADLDSAILDDILPYLRVIEKGICE